VKITVDTNVLVRFAVRDDENQWRAAAKALENAELIAISLSCLCEMVWVLKGFYRFSKEEIAAVLHSLLNAGNVVINRAVVEAGLAVLEAGGDFADGAIAYEGGLMGGEIFLSFDKKAVALVAKQGQQGQLLS
jgi:predicted nucleic-acid-binding protein